MAAKRARGAQSATKAAHLLSRLSQEAFREYARLYPHQLDVLHRIASGEPIRNAAACLRAIELLASYAYSKPKQEHEHSGDVTISVVSGIAAPPGGAEITD
jgi:hypothetical protein